MPAKKQPEPTPQDNFITGVALMQAHHNLQTIRAAAEHLGIIEITLHKIMNRSQRPTYDQMVLLCKKEGLSANWLLLNEGSPYQREQTQLNDIMEELQSLRTQLFVQSVQVNK